MRRRRGSPHRSSIKPEADGRNGASDELSIAARASRALPDPAHQIKG